MLSLARHPGAVGPAGTHRQVVGSAAAASPRRLRLPLNARATADDWRTDEPSRRQALQLGLVAAGGLLLPSTAAPPPAAAAAESESIYDLSAAMYGEEVPFSK